MINKALKVSLRFPTTLKKGSNFAVTPYAECKEQALKCWPALPWVSSHIPSTNTQLPSTRRLPSPAHHPSQPQAGLAGRAHGDAPGGNIWRSLQRLDDAGGLAERAGTHHVHLPHPEPGAEKRCSVCCTEWYLSSGTGQRV